MSLRLQAPDGAPLVIPTFTGDYFFLSNFFVRPIVVNVGGSPIAFPASEYVYQAAKSKAMISDNGMERREFIQNVLSAPDCTASKRAGRAKPVDKAKWDAMKVNVMRECVYEKFYQHTDLRQQLMDTGSAMLVEGNTWGDEFWGRCNGRGYNMLGVVLMEVRGYFYWHEQRTPLTPSPRAGRL